MYAYVHTWYLVCKYVLSRTTYEYRGYTLIQNSFNRGKADAYGEKQQSVRITSLIGSKLAKIS